jgi:hypothetical protein
LSIEYGLGLWNLPRRRWWANIMICLCEKAAQPRWDNPQASGGDCFVLRPRNDNGDVLRGHYEAANLATIKNGSGGVRFGFCK